MASKGVNRTQTESQCSAADTAVIVTFVVKFSGI
jgi:hypothetical protein